MTKNIVFLFLILSSILSCRMDKQEAMNADEVLLPAHTLTIHCPGDVPNSYLHTQVFADSLLYGADPQAPFEIAVFDLKKEQFSHKINLDPNFFKEKIGAFYVHHPDSIFVTGMNYPLVYLLSSSGQIIQKYDLSQMSDTQDFVIPSLFPYTSLYYDGRQKYLYVTTLPYDWDVLAARQQFAERVFDLSTSKMIAKYASLFTERSGILPYDLNIPYRLIVDSTIVISYPMRHEVEIYNLANHELIERKMLGIMQIALPEPLLLHDASDEQKLWNYRITTPFYEPIFYHPRIQCFTRIIHHAQTLKTNGVTLNNGEKRKATLLVFDKQFHLLRRFDFSGGALGVRKSIPLSDGILLAPHEHYWKNDNELAFQYYYKFNLP